MSVKYATLASTIEIEDITTKGQNQYILHKLKNNDDSIHTLYVKDSSFYERDESGIYHEDFDYIPDDGEDLGWLGYYIGQNTKLQEIQFYTAIDNESFYKEMSRNKSIQEIQFCQMSLDERMLQLLSHYFLKDNCSFVKIGVYECNIEGCIPQLSLSIEGCNKSLKCYSFADNAIGENGSIVDIITSLNMHPQLEELDLIGMSIGRNEYTALSSLLRSSTTQLQTLALGSNNIDDEGVEYLVNALPNGNKLELLDLSRNEAITIEGWKKVSTLLERPRCALKKLYTSSNNIGNEGALIFAEALTKNSTLQTFIIDHGYNITDWGFLSKLLCDISSPNNTYLSNHTLQDVGKVIRLPDDIQSYLRLNKTIANKDKVTMAKILRNHSHFDMEPFFEWEFKVVPIMINWFTKATTYTNDAFSERLVKRIKLDSMYAFIREFPMLYIEPMTRQEMAEYSAMEMLLRGSHMQHTSILEEIQRCKTNASQRL